MTLRRSSSRIVYRSESRGFITTRASSVLCVIQSRRGEPSSPLPTGEDLRRGTLFSARLRARFKILVLRVPCVLLRNCKIPGIMPLVRSILRNRSQIAPRANSCRASPLASPAKQAHVRGEIPPPTSYRCLLRRFLLDSTKTDHRDRRRTARRPIRRRRGSQLVS